MFIRNSTFIGNINNILKYKNRRHFILSRYSISLLFSIIYFLIYSSGIFLFSILLGFKLSNNINSDMILNLLNITNYASYNTVIELDLILIISYIITYLTIIIFVVTISLFFNSLVALIINGGIVIGGFYSTTIINPSSYMHLIRSIRALVEGGFNPLVVIGVNIVYSILLICITLVIFKKRDFITRDLI